MSRLWHKGDPLDELVLRFTTGRDPELDARLVPYDVRASKAHARMLAACGHLANTDAEGLCMALDALGEANARGEWSISVEEEDCHTALENRLIERCGDLGKRIHLGRSRNDQVLVALRLYCRDVIDRLRSLAARASEACRAVAETHRDLPMPGYTHLQRAMPTSVTEWARAYAAEIGHSAAGFDAAHALADLNPLGSAAGYGTPGLGLDRDMTTRELGFGRTHEPAAACQLSRGKAEAALAFAIVLILQDLGKFGTDVCLFASQEFGFVRLPAVITTGSSIMPQKRNPDVFEVIRARAALSHGDLAAILAITAKMPAGYHRDFQLLKEPLFRLIDNAIETLTVFAAVAPRIEFVPEKLAEALSPDLYAAQRAYALVQEEGLAFRDAYALVAREFA